MALGTLQTLAWASSYYLPAILADPISTGIGVPRSWVFAAFSVSLLMQRSPAPAVGRAIDRNGGRGVLVFSNLVLAGGLTRSPLQTARSGLFGAWAILGVGMALGLYDAGFAALTAFYGQRRVVQLPGSRSLAGSPHCKLAVIDVHGDAVGWRETCLIWAGLNLVVALPLNRLVLPVPGEPSE